MGGPLVSAGDYFVYISRNKVDQLTETIDSRIVEELSETRTTETDVSVDAHVDWNLAHILSLFKIGGTYGRKDIIARERKVRETYASKLRTVLLAIARQETIPDLAASIASDHWPSVYYHHLGTFEVTKPPAEMRSSAILTIGTTVDKRRLLLDCTLRNFSEGNQPDGTFEFDSARSGFLSGQIGVRYSTVFVLTSHNRSRITGSPLFLKLHAGG
jgi:hypothetical protein